MRIKLRDKQKWHEFFCLRPRIVENHLVWFEKVWRKQSYKEVGCEGYMLLVEEFKLEHFELRKMP